MDEINRLLDAIQVAAYKCGYYKAKTESKYNQSKIDKEYLQGRVDEKTKLVRELREELTAWLKQRG